MTFCEGTPPAPLAEAPLKGPEMYNNVLIIVSS